ncbi:hypothetical protein [Ramlibacter tataouinensis]|uniref:Uncharacterized protein n=1 Tax=Ramlibacter tataouinensis (strain ATCC BAA-407 / DSM 14655 / LMG 21543 / TTB310) TaxID=365046 RepID=F5Y134_RAMTT|nr:hypothetical protein [Ramlibacter tataouinensis]AEG92252.1 conserved hypothetical protein [Ramlibacter tataouinensis TTB310]
MSTNDSASLFTPDALRQLGESAGAGPCPSCAALACPGWEAVPGTYDTRRLRCVGTLRDPGVEDPTLEEYRPGGGTLWAPDAPIAPAYFPYNRCDVWQCASCGRPFLRYTEYGGYYVEHRIRELDPRRVVDAAP